MADSRLAGHQFQPADGKPLKGTKGRDKVTSEQRTEAEFAERVIDIACHAWTHRRYEGGPAKGVSPGDIESICREFDTVSSIWSKLPVGGSMTLDWTVGRSANKR